MLMSSGVRHPKSLFHDRLRKDVLNQLLARARRVCVIFILERSSLTGTPRIYVIRVRRGGVRGLIGKHVFEGVEIRKWASTMCAPRYAAEPVLDRAR